MNASSRLASAFRAEAPAKTAAIWMLPLLALVLLAGPATAQRNDQIWFVDRDGSVRQTSGLVVENSLSTVRVRRGGDRESTYDPDRVRRIEWGQTSVAFREGREFGERGDHVNAVRKFRESADSDEREVVQAAARLRAAQALLDLGAREPESIAEAVVELDRFLADFPQNRDVPEARTLRARATWLEGKADEAAEQFRLLFEETTGTTPSPGYDPLLCLEAGLSAARAFLEAGDTLRAREVFGALDSAAAARSAQLAPESTERAAAERIAAEARLGEGFVLLAAGQPSQAVPFFEARRSQPEPTVRFASDMGLGEAYLAQNKLREAQVKFASVSALDYTDRYRAARARLRLAETTRKLGDSGAPALTRRLLTEIVERFGDTPAARQAREMLDA